MYMHTKALFLKSFIFMASYYSTNILSSLFKEENAN